MCFRRDFGYLGPTLHQAVVKARAAPPQTPTTPLPGQVGSATGGSGSGSNSNSGQGNVTLVNTPGLTPAQTAVGAIGGSTNIVGVGRPQTPQISSNRIVNM